MQNAFREYLQTKKVEKHHLAMRKKKSQVHRTSDPLLLKEQELKPSQEELLLEWK